jgi:hypothetical protein
MTDEHLQQLFAAMQQENAAAHAETRRLFEETWSHFDLSTEAIEHDLDLLAEAIAALGDRISREIVRLDEKLDQRLAKTQAMIPFVASGSPTPTTPSPSRRRWREAPDEGRASYRVVAQSHSHVSQGRSHVAQPRSHVSQPRSHVSQPRSHVSNPVPTWSQF